jgi:hypothetical protein
MAGFDDRLLKRLFAIHWLEHPRPIPNDHPLWLVKLWLLTMGTAMPLVLAWST